MNTVEPSSISVYSNKRFWWRCHFDHSWEATPANRINGRGCLQCRKSSDPEIIKYKIREKYGITEEWLRINYVESSNSFEDLFRIHGIGHTVLRKALNVYSLSKDKSLIKESKNSKRDSTNLERYGETNPYTFARNKRSSFEIEIDLLLREIINSRINKITNSEKVLSLNNRYAFNYSNTEVIKPKELDFYFSELKIAIEFNGNYWHDYDLWTLDIKNKTLISKEMIKTKLCESEGVKLFHIWECDWIKKSLTQKKEILEEILDWKN